MPDQATQNSNTQWILPLKIQTQLNSSFKKSKKLAILEPKLEIFKQKSSLVYVQTWHLKLDKIQTWSCTSTPITVWRGNEWLLYDTS